MSDVEIIGKLELVNINTPDGDFGFIVGTDGRFRDINGKLWIGSQLIRAGKLDYSIQGTNPEGELSLAFFQDPDAPDLVSEIKALGADYVANRLISFYVQPITDVADMYAPKVAPVLIMTRTMRTVRFSADGAQNRQIAVTFESAWEFRRAARRLIYNTTDHARLIGENNPSLEFIPTVDFQEQKLFD